MQHLRWVFVQSDADTAAARVLVPLATEVPT